MISVSRNQRSPIARSRRRRTVVPVLLGLLFASQAAAQTTEATMRTAARELATQGAEAYERGDYAFSYDRLTRAFALYPVPSIRIMQARALVHLGRLIEALDIYEETRRMPLAADAPEAFTAATRDATVEAEQLRSTLPRLFIRVRTEGTAPKEMTVSLDGKVLPAALLEVDCPVDPGEHVVTLQALNRAPVTRKVKALVKDRLVVDLSLPSAPNTSASDTLPALVPQDESTVDASRKRWGFGVIGGGAVALLGSVITGTLALDKKDYLDGVCKPGCPEGSQNDIDSFRTYRTVSYVAAGLSLSLVGVGGYLLLTDKHAERTSAIGVNPNGITWAGRF